MSKRPAEPDLRRLQGIPRVKWCQTTGASNYEDADDAVFLAGQYGLIPDPWQVDILRQWLARRGRGNARWVHRSCGLAVPRQNGKNGAVEVLELYCLIVLGEWILHTAHELKTSRKAFKRLKHFFGEKRDDPNAKFPELNALVADVRNVNGQEAIILKDLWRVDGALVRSIGRPLGTTVEHVARGGLIEFATRTGGGARGTTYDRLIIDEGQHLAEEDLAAVRPVISSGALGNSQIVYLGTPPDPDKLGDGFGAAFSRIRSNAGNDKGLCWIEYGAPDGPRPDLEDLVLLYACNPSLDIRHGNGDHGLDWETVEGERLELNPDAYARERYGWWGNPEAKSHRGVIDMDQWRSLRVAGDTLPARGLIVVDVDPHLEWTSVAIATDGPNGRPLGLVDRHEGQGWVVKRVKQLYDDLGKKNVLEVALTPTAKMFSAPLTAAGIDHKQLTAGDVGAACMATQKMIKDGELAHVAQPELDDAARSAITKLTSETQQWERRGNKTDISALVAFSVAIHRWALTVAVKPRTVPAPRTKSSAGTTARTKRPAEAANPLEQSPSSPARPRRATGGFDPRSSGF
ncbi:hypothetical protein Back2_17780 [Nocardioides baekrokdamisoli]|uniref:Terminase n=1 Tax=Nocardioides baekrokdamisoli TaxID=1804624 RepID=A0A3G9IV04_9ACTN|nr:hypothetical protein [Nocardioides baekrokdamisoli]BBH17491.1 hypothetical protein Back2_17780 [Nocardioides baekrokdamisoli]